MYQYTSTDKKIVTERADQFQGQVTRRVSGSVKELEFKPLRLQNGLYMQLHAYMLRVNVPYGLLNSKQLRMNAHIARTYDKGYAHFTTRQNIQYNWPELDDVPKILKDLASVEMHAIQSSGNCIRNTTSDPFAGVARDEIEDPRPYGELIRQWSTFHPEFAYLPRKFKIAVTGTPDFDRAAVRVHDIGVRLVKNDKGELGCEIMAGGGLGRTPVVGKVLRDWLPREDMLTYLDAILRVYNTIGRRDNKYKARIKITINETGVDKFRAMVDEEFELMRDEGTKLTQAELDRVSKQFVAPTYKKLASSDSALTKFKLSKERDFGHWVTNNVIAHKVDGYSAAVISLKTKDTPPGDVSDTQLDKIADIADKYSFGEAVVTHAQNLVLPNVETEQLPALYAELKEWDLAEGNYNLVTDTICCPGLDFCALANARSIPVALEISERFADLDYQEDIGELNLKISGCINACGHHHVGHIGILGIDRRGKEAYQLMLGGSPSDDASLAQIIGPALAPDKIVDALETVLKTYLGLRTAPEERFLDCYRRVGATPFKEAVYADN